MDASDGTTIGFNLTNSVPLSEQLKSEIETIALKSSVDLREFAAQINSDMSELEHSLIQKYISAGPYMAQLHKQITTCDSILERMEAILTNFHEDLGTISSEIQDLQMKSTLMSKRLQNRQSIREELSQFLSDMAIPETLIMHILNTPVSEQEFLEHLHELDHKINFSLGQSISEYKSLEDVSTLLKNLKIKAITKIREYLLQKIYSLRRPLTNYQIPQNQLLKYRFYNEFLLAHDRETAREILTEYVNTMSKVYYSYFKAYCAKLNKVQLDTTSDKDILLGKRFEEQGAYGSGSSVISTMSFPTSSSTNSSPSAGAGRVGIFALGDRATRVLSKSGLEAPIVLPHVAVKGDVKYPLEVLFRSIQFALLDVACREYFFLSDFFFLSPESPESLSYQAPALQHAPTGEALTALFDQVMGRTLNLLRKQVESNLIPIGSHDALGLLICLQVLHAMLRLARERGVHVMEKFWTSLTETLWVHVTDRLDAHIASLRNDFDVTNFNISARGLVGTMAGGVSGSGLSGRTYPLIRPHAVARRYAELAASLHSIGHGYPGSPLFPDSDDGTLKQKSGEASSSPRSSYGGPSSFPTGSLSGISALRVSVQSNDKSIIKPTLDARILSRLAQLQTQFECVLTRLGNSFPTQRLKCVFLINNFDLVLSVLTERGAGDSAEAVRCREAAAKHTTTFINEALTPYFGSLISFVRDFESQQTPNSVLQVGNEPETSAIARNEEARAIRIIKGFNIDWKNSIEKIHSEIMIEFANFTLGTEIYQAVLTQLVHHYHQFQNVMSQPPYKQLPVRNQLVNIHHIMNEIKKCKSTF